MKDKNKGDRIIIAFSKITKPKWKETKMRCVNIDEPITDVFWKGAQMYLTAKEGRGE